MNYIRVTHISLLPQVKLEEDHHVCHCGGNILKQHYKWVTSHTIVTVLKFPISIRGTRCIFNLRNTNILWVNSTEPVPYWEADWCSASQEILSILWDPKIHYRVSLLRQINPVQTFRHISSRYTIKLPSTPGTYKESLSYVFSQNCHKYTTFFIYFYYSNKIWRELHL
jgi:hypothetical protein